jgi:hypothetical protein
MVVGSLSDRTRTITYQDNMPTLSTVIPKLPMIIALYYRISLNFYFINSDLMPLLVGDVY